MRFVVDRNVVMRRMTVVNEVSRIRLLGTVVLTVYARAWSHRYSLPPWPATGAT